MTAATKERIETTVDRPTPVIPELPPNATDEMQAEHQRLSAASAEIAEGRTQLREQRAKVLAGIDTDPLGWSGSHIADELRLTEFDLLKAELQVRQELDIFLGQIESLLQSNAKQAIDALAKFESKLVTSMVKHGFDRGELIATFREDQQLTHDFSTFLRATNPVYVKMRGECTANTEPVSRQRARNKLELQQGLDIVKRMTVFRSGLG